MTAGAQALVRRLAAAWATTVYGVPGQHRLAIVDELDRSPNVDFVSVRHEGAAATMAEAHAKLTGRLGGEHGAPGGQDQWGAMTDEMTNNMSSVSTARASSMRRRWMSRLLVQTTKPPLRGTNHVELESGAKAYREAMLHLTLPFSLVGVPAISLPYGEVGGLPVGVQLVTARGKDDELLALGRWLEDRLAMHPTLERNPLSSQEKR